jgi:Uma2 family endonuclease
MATVPTKRATIEDLLRTEGKAELIGGRIVHFMATGRKPNRTAFRIARSLDDHAEATGQGETYTDNMGFTVPELPSGRESFSPDVSYYVGPLPENDMRFIEGPPTLAVEVRSENDYGQAAEREMADKRADYFAAGTLVVWDVDPVAERVHVYRPADPARPATYAPGQDAEAEPAVAGWSIPVNRVFGRA